MKHWQIKQGDKVFGPYSDAEIRTLVSSGRINRKTPIRTDENSIWMVAGRIPGLFPDETASHEKLQTGAVDSGPKSESDSEKIWDDADLQVQPESDSKKIWYIARDGNKSGPGSFESLKKGVGLGRVRPTDLIWKTGQKDWQPASTVDGLFPDDIPPLPTNVSSDADINQRRFRYGCTAILLVFCGALLVLYGALGVHTYVAMDTTVLRQGQWGVERVHNVGLMQDRMVGLMVSFAECASGLFLVFLGLFLGRRK